MGVKFSVNALRRELEKKGATNEEDFQFVWNMWAPLKCNYLLWRALQNRVASKMGLCHRGVSISDTHCERCGYEVETVEHIFVSCLFARSIWWNFFVWVRIPMPNTLNSLKEIIKTIQESPGSQRWKKIVYTAALATVWSIWAARNAKVFEGRFIPVRRMIEAIKEDAFVWISNRSKLPTLDWDNWVSFDVSSLL
ncbi:putative reverse transcriptase zinc-binding domain-containing protein [Helianthus annuus]|nr:putative reverse transcriptase zinc-binding domain-containing protein [Helianthus annuus]